MLPKLPKQRPDFPIETRERDSKLLPGSTAFEEAVEKSVQTLKQHRNGMIPDADLVRRVEVSSDGTIVPLETKRAFAALDIDKEDLDIAGELLGRFEKKGRRFNTPKFSRAAPKVLYAMGFDPIVELVRAHSELTEEIDDLRKTKHSALEYTELVKVRNKIATDLLRYGYVQTIPEVADTGTAPSITINLT